jgi:Mrp family chromosome partitioning ATPase
VGEEVFWPLLNVGLAGAGEGSFMAAMAAWVAKPPPLSLQTGDTAFFPRCGCKWAAPRAPLSSSRRVAARASGAKLVTLVGKGGAGKTTAAVLAAQVTHHSNLRN